MLARNSWRPFVAASLPELARATAAWREIRRTSGGPRQRNISELWVLRVEPKDNGANGSYGIYKF